MTAMPRGEPTRRSPRFSVRVQAQMSSNRETVSRGILFAGTNR
jgi:hypothetical protein